MIAIQQNSIKKNKFNINDFILSHVKTILIFFASGFAILVYSPEINHKLKSNIFEIINDITFDGVFSSTFFKVSAIGIKFTISIFSLIVVLLFLVFFIIDKIQSNSKTMASYENEILDLKEQIKLLSDSNQRKQYISTIIQKFFKSHEDKILSIQIYEYNEQIINNSICFNVSIINEYCVGNCDIINVKEKYIIPKSILSTLEKKSLNYKRKKKDYIIYVNSLIKALTNYFSKRTNITDNIYTQYVFLLVCLYAMTGKINFRANLSFIKDNIDNLNNYKRTGLLGTIILSKIKQYHGCYAFENYGSNSKANRIYSSQCMEFNNKQCIYVITFSNKVQNYLIKQMSEELYHMLKYY